MSGITRKGKLMVNVRHLEKSPTLNTVWYTLNICYWLCWLAAFLLVAVTVIMWITDFQPRYVMLPVEVAFHETADGQVSTPLTTGNSVPVVGFSNPRVQAEELPGLQYVMAMPLALLAGLTVILHLLLRLLKNLREGQPFARQNPRFLLVIGWLIAVAGPVYGLLQYIYGKLYINLLDVPGADISVVKDFHGPIILCGLVLVVIARVYSDAVRIKTEADLTI